MFGFGWLFGGSPEITAIEKEQKNFLFLVEDLCKHKILYIVYSQNKCHELPEFDPNDKSRQTMEILFQEMADALKNDIRTMLAKEIELANSIIVKQGFTFIKPMSLEASIYTLYYSALLIHDSISKYALHYNLFGRLEEIVEQLNQIDSVWNMDYDIGELTHIEKEAQEKEIERERRKLRELIAQREKREERQATQQAEERAATLLKSAELRVNYVRNKLEKTKQELDEAQKNLEKVSLNKVSIKVK